MKALKVIWKFFRVMVTLTVGVVLLVFLLRLVPGFVGSYILEELSGVSVIICIAIAYIAMFFTNVGLLAVRRMLPNLSLLSLRRISASVAKKRALSMVLVVGEPGGDEVSRSLYMALLASKEYPQKKDPIYFHSGIVIPKLEEILSALSAVQKASEAHVFHREEILSALQEILSAREKRLEAEVFNLEENLSALEKELQPKVLGKTRFRRSIKESFLEEGSPSPYNEFVPALAGKGEF